MTARLRLLHWMPRIICILAILFVSLFALDSFAPNLTVWQQIGGFLIHLIPSYILILFLILAWKKELIGGIVMTLIGIAFCIFLFIFNTNKNHFSIWRTIEVVVCVGFPFIIVGVLFIVSYVTKKKNLPAAKE